MMGVETARQWTQRFGFEIDRQPDNLTLALGAGSTTPLQLASAYGVLANGGYKVDPVVITRVADAQDKVLFEAPVPKLTETLRVIPERNAFITDSLLQEVTRSGTAALAQATLKRPDLYGKTGTTNEAVDAWFAGFQPSLVGVVWMGYDIPRSLGAGESGTRLSLPVWIDYMKQVLATVPVQPIEPPANVTQVDGDWFYSERAKGDYVMRLGFDEMPKSQTDPSDTANYPPLSTEYPSLPGSAPD
jgi:penicillin-binding protein 1A